MSRARPPQPPHRPCREAGAQGSSLGPGLRPAGRAHQSPLGPSARPAQAPRRRPDPAADGVRPAAAGAGAVLQPGRARGAGPGGAPGPAPGPPPAPAARGPGLLASPPAALTADAHLPRAQGAALQRESPRSGWGLPDSPEPWTQRGCCRQGDWERGAHGLRSDVGCCRRPPSSKQAAPPISHVGVPCEALGEQEFHH